MRGWILILAVFLIGCEEYVYKIVMRPRGEKMERRVSISGGMADDDMVRIGDLYGQAADAEMFVGTFGSNLPRDVGRGGVYRCTTTPLGRAMFYGEQFLGEVDPADSVATMQAGTDELVDILIGWFRAELGEEAGFGKLREFCDKQLRKDIMGMGMTMRMMKIGQRYSEKDLGEEYILRLLMYGFERDYIDGEDVTELLTGDEEALVGVVQRAVARRMGWVRGQAMPKSLTFLAEGEWAPTSLVDYVRTTDPYRRACEKVRQEDPNAEAPDAEEYIFEVIGKVIYAGQLGILSSDTLQVSLETQVAPTLTNGQWDEPNGVVYWRPETLSHGGEVVPVICYAQWVTPDLEFQKQHFGKVAVKGEGLSKYCGWYVGLSEGDRKEWDAFLGHLSPGQELGERIAGYRFCDEKEGASRARLAQEVIAEGIK